MNRRRYDAVNEWANPGRNLISDVVAFLLLAATHLTQTDSLPSLEVVVPPAGKE